MNTDPLQKKRVVIVGLGGLGSPLAWALVKAGVEHITAIDPDHVELSNLHRQILFKKGDIGRGKAVVIATRLKKLNKNCQINPIVEHINEKNANMLLAGHDVICEGTDSIAAKYLANDVGVELGIPLVIAGALGFGGQVFTVVPKLSACYRCVFESPLHDHPATCAQNGVLGSVVGFTAGYQAKETLAILRGKPAELAGKVWMYDALRDRERRVDVVRRRDCETCGDAPIEAMRGVAKKVFW
ncbi:MAG: HesA/MoeB/ThiF family protein [Myxococcales bacterium]|nr:HesA/MoeB/ThiF family protein [Myxococcales bacterium]